VPSVASGGFSKARSMARLLVAAAVKPPKEITAIDQHKSTCLHAALAMLVAAWEAYLERLVREAQQAVADSTNAKLSAALSPLANLTEKEIRRFNTPNAENSRTLLFAHTGYDAINDWQWVAGGLNGIQARTRLDEILQIRHSFAHGYAIPTNIAWAKNRNLPGALNVSTLRSVDRFLSHLVRETDRGLAAYLSTRFGVSLRW
jgi:hypothetical protein